MPQRQRNRGRADRVRIGDLATHVRDLTLIGTITTKQDPLDVHTTLLAGTRIAQGPLTAGELWYRRTDATCCQTGKARAGCTVHDNRPRPGVPAITG